MRYWEEFYFLEHEMPCRVLRVWINNRVGNALVANCGLKILPEFCDMEFENVLDAGPRFDQYKLVLQEMQELQK